MRYKKAVFQRAGCSKARGSRQLDVTHSGVANTPESGVPEKHSGRSSPSERYSRESGAPGIQAFYKVRRSIDSGVPESDV